ncbi:MAG: phosphonopyruvate decarboxylase [Planctomycetes bacterium]|nr:phosphonopyruvate decarboxylase [Planctomycetota bacterium]
MSLHIEPFVDTLRDLGVAVASGVPCSILDPFVSHAASGGGLPYVPATSEGEAVAIAAGSWLSGRFGLVLMQNSGLGNAVNPLTSLCATFDIPVLLVVSQRGHDGRDAPQHELMGRITLPLLELLEIPAFVLPDEDDSAMNLAASALEIARTSRRPAALVVRKGTFEPFACDAPRVVKAPRVAQVESLDAFLVAEKRGRAARGAEEVRDSSPAALPTRHAALTALDAALRDDDLVVSTTGHTSRELMAIHDRPASFPMVGSMGCAPGLALGVALGRPERRTLVVDGDGALLMKLGTLATIGAQRPRNLLHVLLDNGRYESTGGQPSVAPGVSFETLAAGAGYARVVTLRDADELRELVRAFRPGDGPLFAALAVADGHAAELPRPERTMHALRDDFRASAMMDTGAASGSASAAGSAAAAGASAASASASPGGASHA